MNIDRHFRPADLVVWSATILVLAVAPVRPAGAGSTEDHAVIQAECGSCHVAYPARSLSRAAWGQVLGRLDQHYGVDASLDDASLAAVARQLGTQSGARATTTVALPRITTSSWFRDEHDEVRAADWRRPAVKSAANCDACHPRAEHGDFEEHDVRIPR
jgi:nitrate/TMAO reductase-like tetraheme cytochrome c subunit